MAYLIKTKRGWVGRCVLEYCAWQRPFGLVPTGEPFSYWTRYCPDDKDCAHRFPTVYEAAVVCKLLNTGSILTEEGSVLYRFPFMEVD